MFPYIGGKSSIGSWIFENMPKKKWNLYAEVFGGAMWVYIKRPILAREVIYNDYNPFLYNLWLCIVYRQEDILEESKKLLTNDLETFKRIKSKFMEIDRNGVVLNFPNVLLAIEYAYLLTHCFSGNIYGGMKKADFDILATFTKKFYNKKYLDRINTITKVTNMDCNDFIEKFDGVDNFLYLDPPYYKKEHLYGFHNFSKEKHYSLSEALKNTESDWLLSYYMYEYLEDIYPIDKFEYIKKDFTKISTFHGKRGKKETEVLIRPIRKRGTYYFFK